MFKIQDLIFLAILGFLILKFRKNPKVFVAAGIISLVLSIPLFSFWIFFTAQKLIWYAALFFLAAIIINFVQLKDKNEIRN